jgi:hypothetical protein
MAEDDKNKVTSLPPPPTDEIDDEWGSSGQASTAPVTKTPEKAEAKGTKADKAVPARASRRDEDEDEDDEDDDDEDDDDLEDEDDDDDDDDVDRRARARKAAATRAKAESQDWLPDWAPWATLGGLLSIGFLGGMGVIPIDFNLKKSGAAEAASATATAPAPTTSTPRRSASARRPPQGAPGAADQERVSASHLLVSYKGSLRAGATITRTKEEAKARAEEALAKARKGTPFDKVVAEYTDEPGGAARGGKLGLFPRQAMIKPFADAAFALKVGQISNVVETDFGYHVIMRTEPPAAPAAPGHPQ